jgi:hypothetical protein
MFAYRDKKVVGVFVRFVRRFSGSITKRKAVVGRKTLSFETLK